LLERSLFPTELESQHGGKRVLYKQDAVVQSVVIIH